MTVLSLSVIVQLAVPIVAAVASLCCISEARAYCMEPTEPVCITVWVESSFDFCRMQVKNYLGEIDLWQQCQIRDAAAQAQDKADEVVRKFNCHADGRGVCF